MQKNTVSLQVQTYYNYRYTGEIIISGSSLEDIFLRLHNKNEKEKADKSGNYWRLFEPDYYKYYSWCNINNIATN